MQKDYYSYEALRATEFSIQELYVLPTQCTNVFYVDLRTLIYSLYSVNLIVPRISHVTCRRRVWKTGGVMLRGKQNNSETNFSYCHYNPYVDWPGIELGSPR